MNKAGYTLPKKPNKLVKYSLRRYKKQITNKLQVAAFSIDIRRQSSWNGLIL